MNETITKALVFAAELLIAVALIGIAFAVFRQTRDTHNTLTERGSTIATTINEEPLTKYEGLNISGATAVSYIKEIYSEVSEIEYEASDGTTVTDFMDHLNTVGNYTAFAELKERSLPGRYIDPTDV